MLLIHLSTGASCSECKSNCWLLYVVNVSWALISDIFFDVWLTERVLAAFSKRTAESGIVKSLLSGTHWTETDSEWN